MLAVVTGMKILKRGAKGKGTFEVGYANKDGYIIDLRVIIARYRSSGFLVKAREAAQCQAASPDR
jgi:hypothetical protein